MAMFTSIVDAFKQGFISHNSEKENYNLQWKDGVTFPKDNGPWDNLKDRDYIMKSGQSNHIGEVTLRWVDSKETLSNIRALD